MLGVGCDSPTGLVFSGSARGEKAKPILVSHTLCLSTQDKSYFNIIFENKIKLESYGCGPSACVCK